MSAEIIPLQRYRRHPRHPVRLAYLEEAWQAAPITTAHQAMVDIVRVMAPVPVARALADNFANEMESALWERGFIVIPIGDEVTR